MNSFLQKISEERGEELLAAEVRTIQANLGLRCNLSCRHCHVGGSPARPEVMEWPVMESLLRLAAAFPAARVDLTGGAPELNPNFTRLVTALREAGHPVQVRTNLTVLMEAGRETLPGFCRDHQVALVASLPCYLDENVRAQRGSGVHAASIAAIRKLNALGYGREPALPLDLVYNPGGPFLPPDQQTLEEAYRRELRRHHGIEFSRLLTITNMPIGRFLDDLHQHGQAGVYRTLLADAFNPGTVAGLMCRHQICVAWDGTLSDCDFNLVLGLPLTGGLAHHIDDLDPATLAGRSVATGEHCFGCTAGCGSSCGGALVA
jgi:radical SAM/Cys-rich protein